MNEKSLKLKHYEMTAIWDSFEWYIKDKLITIDDNVRSMISEMKTMGVPESMIMDHLPEAFERLKAQIVKEQCEKYDGIDNRTRKGKRFA